jgi:selenocysteine lyase/cysteine desulfurase
MNRRNFARSVAFGGAAAMLTQPGLAWQKKRPLPPTPGSPDERFWDSVREQFLMPSDLAVMNAANLCPSSLPVLETMYQNTRDIDRDASFNNRAKMAEGKENTRRLLAEFLRVSPEEIVITRNTSESNNLVSSGVDLKAGDEVVLFSDNHPSNYVAWQQKSKRFGFAIRIVEQVNPHPGDDYYIEAFTRQFNARTKLVGFTHLTSTVGDLFPAKEICRIARERGALTLIDGAQSFGLLDIDLGKIQPDFYSGSSHKWPCGPKETGVLYINKNAQSKIWPSIYSAYPGGVGVSKTFEAFGQRDEPAIIAFGEALKFQIRIGRKAIEDRARELTQALMEGLRKIDGVKLWTHPDPGRSVAVVSFQPGALDVKKLSDILYEKDHIAGATRLGPDRPGLRFSPHFYNSHKEIERTLAAIKRYLASGV